MERARNYIILLLVLILASSTVALASDYGSRIYRAYISGNMQLWKTAIDEMHSKKLQADNDVKELLNYQYGYIAWCIGNNRQDEAKKYLALAEKNLALLEKNPANGSLVNSYKSAFYGYRIGMNRLLAPVLGLKSIDCAKEAIRLDPENYFGYVQYGNIEFYMPSVFGGSKKEAAEYFLKALRLIERNKEDLKENWNYLSLLTVTAQAYSYTDLNESLRYLNMILELEPGFIYVKSELYPQVLKKKNSGK